MHTNPVARAGAVLLGLEALGLVILAIWQVIALVSGDVASVSSAIALLVLTLVGAAALAGFAVATARGASWGRSGGVVVQVLILAVALGAVTGEFAHPTEGLILAVPAVITFIVLIVATRRAGAEARAQADAERADEAHEE